MTQELTTRLAKFEQLARHLAHVRHGDDGNPQEDPGNRQGAGRGVAILEGFRDPRRPPRDRSPPQLIDGRHRPPSLGADTYEREVEKCTRDSERRRSRCRPRGRCEADTAGRRWPSRRRPATCSRLRTKRACEDVTPGPSGENQTCMKPSGSSRNRSTLIRPTVSCVRRDGRSVTPSSGYGFPTSPREDSFPRARAAARPGSRARSPRWPKHTPRSAMSLTVLRLELLRSGGGVQARPGAEPELMRSRTSGTCIC